MRSAIEKRISRRSFENKEISLSKKSKIVSLIHELNQISGLSMEFVEDGSHAFQNLRKSYGVFSNVRSLVLMKGTKDDEHLKEKLGYYGEALVLEMTDLDLGTCWVGGTFDKDEFEVNANETLICVILIGEVASISLKEKMVRGAMRMKSIKLEDRITSDQSLPKWIEEGMSAVILAPSAKNTSKTIFSYKDNILKAHIIDDYEMDLVDLGIAKKHFEIEAKGKFDFGNGGTFHPHI